VTIGSLPCLQIEFVIVDSMPGQPKSRVDCPKRRVCSFRGGVSLLDSSIVWPDISECDSASIPIGAFGIEL
jgi:hypothetical protein